MKDTFLKSAKEIGDWLKSISKIWDGRESILTNGVDGVLFSVSM